MNKGNIFITFEGVEGCGKTTQAKLLAKYLCQQGHRVLLTSEPGGTKVSNAIRSWLLHKMHDLSPTAELFLFLASRAQLVREVIEPALRRGEVVICDRYTDSTLAYQGYGRGMSVEHLRQLNVEATGGVMPHQTFILEVPVKVGLKRATRKGADRIEREHLVFHQRVASGYRRLAAREPKRIRVISGNGSIEEIQEKIRAVVQ